MPMQSTPLADRFWLKVHKTDTCWLWTGCKSTSGYGKIGLGGKHGPSEYTHRVSYTLERGLIPNGLGVLHHCDVKLCVRPSHLFLGNRSDNALDAVSKGLGNTGDRNPSRQHPERLMRGDGHVGAKLTSSNVLEIRSRWKAGGVKQRALASEYGVSPSVICVVISRKTWRHVD